MGRASAALFLLTGILITFLCIQVNVCLIVVFIITILDLSINFYKVGTLDCTYFYPVLQCILYCNIHMFKALVFILITYYSLAYWFLKSIGMVSQKLHRNSLSKYWPLYKFILTVVFSRLPWPS